MQRLGRDISIVLICKIAVIILAAVFVFGASQRPNITTAIIAHHIFDGE
jgi:hypothetical protein